MQNTNGKNYLKSILISLSKGDNGKVNLTNPRVHHIWGRTLHQSHTDDQKTH